MEGFAAYFAELDDSRTGNAARHILLAILVIALCPMLTGGEDGTDMAAFVETRIDCLRGFPELKQ
jgi:DDE_Tnp_1-associated